MDEFRCTEPVTLRILQPGFADGEVRYEERSATAVVIESRGYRPEDGASAAFEFLLGLMQAMSASSFNVISSA